MKRLSRSAGVFGLCVTALIAGPHAAAQDRDGDDKPAVQTPAAKPVHRRPAAKDRDDNRAAPTHAAAARVAAKPDADGDADGDDDRPAPAVTPPPSQAPTAVEVVAPLPAKPIVAAQNTADSDDDDDDDGPSTQPKAVIVTARRLDAARTAIAPDLGASVYTIANRLVELRPGGETVSLGQVLLQAPGVTQTPTGQLEVRGQTGLQYRINNVIIPEGFTDLSESLGARMEQSIDLVTGALPAQYGLQVGGVVNITTQNGVYQQGGQAQLYGGGQGEIEPAIEYSTVVDGTNVYVSGSYLHSRSGLNALDGASAPHHDKTDQWEGFGYFDHILSDRARLSLIVGATDERFQLPHVDGQNADTQPSPAAYLAPLDVNGTTAYPSDALGGREGDSGQYAIFSYLYASDTLSFQASAFVHASAYRFDPDGVGSLLFTGLAQTIHDRETTAGVQVEGAYDVNAAHTLRAGILASEDRQDSGIASMVLPVDAQGRQTSTTPETLASASADAGNLFSAFAEDEWKLTAALTLNAGLRFDHVHGVADGDGLSPRLNLVWAAGGTTLHAGYARYFVPPQDNDGAGRGPSLAGTTGAPAGTGDDPLRVESDDDYDLGIQQKVARLTLGADAYWRRAIDLIGEAPIGQTLLQRTFNYARGHLHGVEVTANYAAGPVTFWSNLVLARAEGCGLASAQYAFTPAERAAVDNHCLATSNDQRITASGGVSYQIGGLHLSGDLVHGSGTPRTLRLDAPNGARMPAYTQVNLSALYRVTGLGGKPVDLKLDIINAFDRRYQLTDGTAFGGGVAQWGVRRGVFIGAEQSF